MRMKAIRSPAGSESGSALAEMAIVLPLLVLVLIALIEVGRFGDYTVRAGNAARAGVQYGAQNSITALDTAGMQNAASSDANAGAGFTARRAATASAPTGRRQRAWPPIARPATASFSWRWTRPARSGR